jgi:hypothetical protein
VNDRSAGDPTLRLRDSEQESQTVIKVGADFYIHGSLLTSRQATRIVTIVSLCGITGRSTFAALAPRRRKAASAQRHSLRESRLSASRFGAGVIGTKRSATSGQHSGGNCWGTLRISVSLGITRRFTTSTFVSFACGGSG